jgi:hypothetical protein
MGLAQLRQTHFYYQEEETVYIMFVPPPILHEVYFFSFSETLAQESRRGTIRLNTSFPEEESLESTQK